MLHLDDPADPRLDDYRHLTDASARRTVDADAAPHGIFIVEGPLALDQLTRSGHLIRSTVVTPSRAQRLGDRLDGLDPVYVVEREVLSDVCGYDVHRGVLAAAVRPAPTTLADLVGAHERFLVVEGVSDNENVGALFRNAAGLGIEAVVLDRASTDPFYRRSIRVSSGWSMRVPHARVAQTATVIEQLSARGVRTVALTPRADALAVDRAAAAGLLDAPVALVVGAEGFGLSTATIEACDTAVVIPMASEVDSLNVATALAVVAAFAAARRDWR